jgi:hypothetical protein
MRSENSIEASRLNYVINIFNIIHGCMKVTFEPIFELDESFDLQNVFFFIGFFSGRVNSREALMHLQLVLLSP